MSDVKSSLLVREGQTLIVPEPGYADSWVTCLIHFSPDLKNIAKPLFSKLANWASWESGRALASGNVDGLVDLKSLDTLSRIQFIAAQRAIMVHEFGIHPRSANTIAWNNPVGGHEFHLMDMERSEVYLGPDRPSVKQLNEEMAILDKLNRSMLWDTRECSDRLQEFTRPEVYAALFHHLGWQFTPTDMADPVIAEVVPVNLIGHLADPEVGKVAVFCAPFSSNPNLRHDELDEIATRAMMMRQEALGTKVLLMHSKPLVRALNHHDTGEEVTVSIFGKIFFDDSHTWLALPSTPISFADLFVDLVAAHSSGSADVLDHDFETALRFEHVRGRSNPLVPEANGRQPAVEWSGTGWDSISFEPLEQPARSNTA
ncbi:hypothetical protein QAO71_17365 (plasmid) [Halopseudomonas sp. SMJS2]|uniref:hypothetical protein n=1 Tax=Halopseudomonas sp. SMJS2 TaxID=3041098 RepID=UPI0024530015|nr:hypothetical protein [Halopseudomonas sp. SMJS2]WGK63538.1 hypothetical protein QAO71_17365 [Halopseudomonas sp. SMJS2]